MRVSIYQRHSHGKNAVTVTDGYVFHLADKSDNNPHFDSNPLGYYGSFYLAGTPTGFVKYQQYGWWVIVLGSNGEGTSHYSYNVTFK